MALVGFMILRRKSIALSLRKIREVPFLFYAWILTLLYVLLFQAFGNFGLLVRERSIVLPALYVLLALDVKLVQRVGAGVVRRTTGALPHSRESANRSARRSADDASRASEEEQAEAQDGAAGDTGAEHRLGRGERARTARRRARRDRRPRRASS